METLPGKGSEVEITFGCGNRMVSATGLVRDVNGDEIVLDIDGGDNTMTPLPGTDIYLLKGGGLFNVIDSKNYPRIRIEKVHERLHARVDDFLKVSYRRIGPGDSPEGYAPSHVILEDVFGETQNIPDIDDVSMSMLYRLLYQLNLKVDRLMDSMHCQEEERYKTIMLDQVNISASGIRLNLTEKLDLGDMVALSIALPLETTTRIRVLAKVVASSHDEARQEYRISFQFIDLSEELQETITRYVFKRQRELLRR